MYTYFTLNLTELLPVELELDPPKAGKLLLVRAKPCWPRTVPFIVISDVGVYLVPPKERKHLKKLNCFEITKLKFP